MNDEIIQHPKLKIQSVSETRADWKKWFDYKWIVKNFTFFLFLSGLAVLYIANGHYADKTIMRINQTSRELKELQYEYKTVKSELMFRSKQSELVKAVAILGLEELKTPPVKLDLDSLKQD